MLRHHLLLATTLLGARAGGCTRVPLAPDVALHLHFQPRLGPPGATTRPSGKGATMRIWVRSSDDNEKMTGWRLESSDPSVLTIVKTHVEDGLSADCHAAGEGVTTLRVRDANG